MAAQQSLSCQSFHLVHCHDDLIYISMYIRKIHIFSIAFHITDSVYIDFKHTVPGF